MSLESSESFSISRASSPSPGRRYAQFLPVLKGAEILDFGLDITELRRTTRIASWLDVAECYLKLEISHPTRTVKDRTTELVYSYFEARKIRRYAHCSAGNAGTSLVWGAGRLSHDFEFESFIPETQFPYHNFGNISGLTVALVEGADYEQAKQYCSWYAREVVGQPEYMHFASGLRQQANKVPYLEAFEQLKDNNADVDYVVQAISDGGGIIGAKLAAVDAVAQGWIPKSPAFVITQPDAANPVVRCFRKGFASYDDACTLTNLEASRAFAIRRKNAAGYYAGVYEVIRSGGFALDASEDEITMAKSALSELENIDAGYTACTSLAALKKENQATGAFKGKNVLVMITGADRPTDLVPKIDRVIPETEWRKVTGSTASSPRQSSP
jgi:threonine synthase